MARIITASCPSCGANLKLSGDEEVVKCDFCGAESFIERPTAKKGESSGVSQKGHYVIYVQEADPEPEASVLGILAFVLLLVLLIGGGIIYEHYPEVIQEYYPELVEGAPAAESVDYHDGSQDILSLFQAEAGQDIRVNKVVIYPEFVMVETLRETSEVPVQRYLLRKGAFEEPRPSRVTSSQLEDLSKTSFLLSNVDFSLVPKVLAETQKESGLINLTQRYVVINRLRSTDKPEWLVYIGSEGRTFHCRYRLDGPRIDCN